MKTVQTFQRRYLPNITPADFFVLLAHATRKEKVFLLAHPDYSLTDEEAKRTTMYLMRRLKHEPVAYITGHKEFYGREFLVTRDTLIPRPETELLITCTIDRIRNKESLATSGKEITDIIDVGTGSGNIIITLVKELLTTDQKSNTKFYALDISRAALAVAAKNAERHMVSDQITFWHSDLIHDFPCTAVADHHVIFVANLPYLSGCIYAASDLDVRDYEPRSALESGRDGLNHYRRLLSEIQAWVHVARSITIFLEISPEQNILIQDVTRQTFPAASLRMFSDLSGRIRLIQATF